MCDEGGAAFPTVPPTDTMQERLRALMDERRYIAEGGGEGHHRSPSGAHAGACAEAQ